MKLTVPLVAALVLCLPVFARQSTLGMRTSGTYVPAGTMPVDRFLDSAAINATSTKIFVSDYQRRNGRRVVASVPTPTSNPMASCEIRIDNGNRQAEPVPEVGFWEVLQFVLPCDQRSGYMTAYSEAVLPLSGRTYLF